MKFIRYKDLRLINLSNVVAIDKNLKSNSIEFDSADNCFYWTFETLDEMNKVYDNIVHQLESRHDSLVEIRVV